MNELSLQYNRGKIWRFALVCVILVVFSVAGLFFKSGIYGYTISWLGIFFGGIGLPALLYLAFNRQVQCRISPEKIVFHMKTHLNHRIVSDFALDWESIEKIEFSGSVALFTLRTEKQILTANFSLLDVDWAKLQTWLPEMPQVSATQREKLLQTHFQAA